jgi:hypothetical protein
MGARASIALPPTARSLPARGAAAARTQREKAESKLRGDEAAKKAHTRMSGTCGPLLPEV